MGHEVKGQWSASPTEEMSVKWSSPSSALMRSFLLFLALALFSTGHTHRWRTQNMADPVTSISLQCLLHHTSPHCPTIFPCLHQSVFGYRKGEAWQLGMSHSNSLPKCFIPKKISNGWVVLCVRGAELRFMYVFSYEQKQLMVFNHLYPIHNITPLQGQQIRSLVWQGLSHYWQNVNVVKGFLI